MLYVTGGPLEAGYPFAEHQTYAERGLAGLIRQGLAPEMAQAVPAPATLKDRTYGSAVALRKWLQDHGIHPGKFNVVSIGPHARRTRLLFRKAFRKRSADRDHSRRGSGLRAEAMVAIEPGRPSRAG